jgi:hypothetical protein
MTRTSSMIYKETAEANELYIYTVNTESLYRQRITPTLVNLSKKMKKGTYDKDKAVDLWYYTATAASDLYGREYGYRFSVQDRFTVATDLEAYYREDVEEMAQA